MHEPASPLPPSPRRKTARFWGADAGGAAETDTARARPTRSAAKVARERIRRVAAPADAARTEATDAAPLDADAAADADADAAVAGEEERTRRPMALLSIVVNSLDNLAHGVAIAASYNLSLRVGAAASPSAQRRAPPVLTAPLHALFPGGRHHNLRHCGA